MEVFYGKVHPALVLGTAVHATQYPSDTLKFSIIDQPVICDHVGHHPLNILRQQFVIFFQQPVKTLYE